MLKPHAYADKMYSFEGDFKQRPQQSLGGASRKVPREKLLQRAAQERQQREEKRRQLQAAVKIQAFFRACSVRKKEKSLQRQSFDEIHQSCGNNHLSQNPAEFGLLLQKIAFFYFEQTDANRLVWLSQTLIKQSVMVSRLVVLSSELWLPKLYQLLHLNLRHLAHIVSSDAPLAVPLRVLEVFTNYHTYLAVDDKQHIVGLIEKLWNYVIKKGYFSKLCAVLNHKVPESLEYSTIPPTLLAASLLDLFLRPLLLPNSSTCYRIGVIHALMQEVFIGPLTPQVLLFLLPALTLEIAAFPPSLLLSSLLCGTELAIPATSWLLYSILTIVSPQAENLTGIAAQHYLLVLYHLVASVPFGSTQDITASRNLDSEDDDDTLGNIQANEGSLQDVVEKALMMLNETNHVKILLAILEQDSNSHNLMLFSSVCHTLLCHHKLAVHKYRLLYTLAFKPSFLWFLWQSVISASTSPVFGTPTPLLQCVVQGILLVGNDEKMFLPQITLFCALLNYLLPTLHDVEFYGEEVGTSIGVVPFSLTDLATISLHLRNVCLGLIDLAYPDMRLAVREDYENAMKSVGAGRTSHTVCSTQVQKWTYLFRVAVTLLRQLYIRDSRRSFCPPGHWIARQLSVPVEKAADLHLSKKRLQGYEPFQGPAHLTREQLEEEGPPLSTAEVRHLAVLQELPFVIHFHDRVKICQSIIQKDKLKNQGELANFQMGQQIQVLIRRNYIYEDAFDKLSPENEPNLKLRMRVQLVNAVGLDEAGIDGGGIFREFLNELLKTAFDPNRGFFKTTHDCQLYPNPGVHMVIEDFARHYYFIGRMLGKAMYENMLVELPFAAFFLAKLLSRHSTTDVDIHHLASLDPVMYRNLLYLKTYQGDVSDLGLDFTVMCSELGENQVVELKPGGANIPVTEANRINYIHLMADYKLNKQIRAQCQAFKEGLANVVDLEWLHMFDPNEFQILISGAQMPVDLEDLKCHTNYAGGYYAEHPVIQAFWRVVDSFTEQQRRQLLKFVTSCSRPPLLGFKELSPAFCIQNAGSEADRLPTASTCMNLLKLPEFQNEETLKSKLLYAVESGAGFELS